MSSARSASLPSKFDPPRRAGLTGPSASTCASSTPAARVSSAAISSASRRIRAARSEMSSRLPIGVARLAAELVELEGRAELRLEILLEPIEHALLELAGALAADLVAVADLLQRQRLLGPPALAGDRLVPAPP